MSLQLELRESRNFRLRQGRRSNRPSSRCNRISGRKRTVLLRHDNNTSERREVTLNRIDGLQDSTDSTDNFDKKHGDSPSVCVAL